MLEIKKLAVVEWRHEKVEVFIFGDNDNLYDRILGPEYDGVCRDERSLGRSSGRGSGW